ncbi:tol-pal system-associated acyl-CoA thioesterase [Phenylobacterium immobile]|uniref:tol-pal system-associated acyl-CoA thioesterase n=1 Tax=Phenylobacterium immobile TaxID=21 RepID=UPI000AD39FC3|nr:tol-pal system-associated acyl-CoA thioesterase [Phenylobacterium immobile]
MNEPSSGWLEGREHVLGVRIYYEDTDLSGLVYHANYLRYFERGRSNFLRLAGVDHTRLLNLADPMAFAITRLEINYRRAARIDDALMVRTRYDALKGARLVIAQRILRGEELICEARIEAACIDLGGRAKRPPRDLVAAIAPFFAPSGATDAGS